MTVSRLTIYDASAGSGKTFKIATRYLNKIIQARESSYIYRLIGITFTNKAAEEMKKRIINNLIQAARGNLTDVMKQVAEDSREIIKKQTGIETEEEYKKELIERSRKRLFEVLHYYDEFQLTTIDKLMFQLIKTFSRDLHLSGDVNVILNHEEVIGNLINQIINQAQPGSPVSEFLIDLALQKIDQEEFKDITDDLLHIVKIIFDDNYFNEIKQLEDKSLSDFVGLKKHLDKEIKKIENQLINYGKKLSNVIKNYESHVIVRTLARDLVKKPLIAEINKKQRKQFAAENPVYYIKTHIKEMEPGQAEKVKGEINRQIHEILAEMIPYVDENLEKLKLLIALRKENNALSLQHELLQEIEQFKINNNSIFIHDFNKLILEEILRDIENDTPYLYMRLGEKYAHYFIDEFQDTSALQWKNLIPLIKEGLSKEFGNREGGTTTIVGDAKQSIYRFRGGKPEQFIALSNPEITEGEGNPFAPAVTKNVEKLKYNWRSLPEIIHFNNRFFSTFPNHLEEPYKQAYNNVEQEIPVHKKDQGGYVNIRFLKKQTDNANAENESFPEAVLENIQQAERNGYMLNEICILVDRHQIGRKVADFLNEHQIDVVSSESLLVNNSLTVQFLLHWLQYLTTGNDFDLYAILTYLIKRDNLDKVKTYQLFFETKNVSKEEQINKLKNIGYELDYKFMAQGNLYDLLVYLIEVFRLNNSIEQAYLQAFMEKVYTFENQGNVSVKGFLDEWNYIADKFSIAVPDKKSAVRIMTVHSAKGLEFPVVIYYTNGSLLSGKDKQNKVWIPLNEKEYEGFSLLPVSMSVIENSTKPVYQKIYNRIKNEKTFDNLNRLYVALTRASEQLFVILEAIPKKTTLIGYNQIFENYLKPFQQHPDQSVYEFGRPQRNSTPKKDSKNTLSVKELSYHYWQKNQQEKNLIKIHTQTYERWKTAKKEAIDYGMQIHDILAKIEDVKQWKKYKNKFLAAMEHPQAVEQVIEQIIYHPVLKPYFAENVMALNETDLLIPADKNFIQKRPDRLIIRQDSISIIDYKTGKMYEHHKKQIDEYARILSETGFKIDKKILVYIQKDGVEIIEVS